MTRVRWRMIGMVVVLVLLPISGLAQRQPNLSGHWELVEALATGTGRDGTVSDKPRPTTSTTISGAAFNCGRACTITHKGQTLTIANARLADSVEAPDVVLRLDGQQANVINSFGAPGELSTTAGWKGENLEIVTGDRVAVWKQVLSLERTELVVVSAHEGYGIETIFRYRKK
jgi:hypothetical protein